MPSLTLTDPDMILPYGSDRESQTPSPPSQLVYLSNLNARYCVDAHSNGRPKKNFSRHWANDDVNNRRLSDIGEELSPSRLGGFDEEDSPRDQGTTSSPDTEEQLTAPETGEYAGSSSSSTVSAGSTRASTAKQASSPQIATEPSPNPAESVNKPGNGDVGKTGLPSTVVASTAAKGKGPGDEFSSAILSSEAERILENAKKRLTLMEGNLNRARSAVRHTPSPSQSSPATSPIGSHQPGGLYRSISHRKGSALRRQSVVASQDASTNRHSRVHSETNFPSESMSNDTKKMSRSVSAMGSSSRSNLNTDQRSFQYGPGRAYLTHRASISSMQAPQQENRQENQQENQQESQQPSPETAQSPVIEQSQESSPAESPKGLGISSEDDVKSTPGDFSPVYSSYGPPSRAQSQLQVRDLQYQMKGLHIKISSLKVRNQEDNLRRRSLQSLRTPSPLTAADPWYKNGLELREGQSSRGSNTRRDGSSEYAREVRSLNPSGTAKYQGENNAAKRNDDSSLEPSSAIASPPTGHVPWQTPPVGYDDGRQSVAESMYEDAEEGEIDREALDEILREPLDADLEEYAAEGVPHEEREDAFDYEHFILHSALGNYSGQFRRPSQVSQESTETTRPAQASRSRQQSRSRSRQPSRSRSIKHSRNNSAMSVSTVATFATAMEGDEMTEEEEDLLYWDRRFNHELRRQPSPVLETDRSETPRGPQHGDVPINSQPQTPSRALDVTGRSSGAGSATPTSLVSSLVSTVRAASSPHPGSATPTGTGGINSDDTQMLEQLFSSLGNVCMDLQAITTSPDPDMKAARVLRRRLDAARRVLDGELDA
ncbi:hypothetical protein N7476_006134 [Penicillium atrosanguineum]|uniref:Uncharacterized protein n=1 Tax=Penicillium atrosanguineum TaxID=1132637 RepID=A0A9W9U438_9EURO|nr:hypothetical protein N7476_006134 [Penicillium atrosanguineum]